MTLLVSVYHIVSTIKARPTPWSKLNFLLPAGVLYQQKSGWGLVLEPDPQNRKGGSSRGPRNYLMADTHLEEVEQSPASCCLPVIITVLLEHSP